MKTTYDGKETRAMREQLRHALKYLNLMETSINHAFVWSEMPMNERGADSQTLQMIVKDIDDSHSAVINAVLLLIDLHNGEVSL